LYSFKSGEYIKHRLFEQEKYRIDLNETIPSMAWDAHPVYRSFDIFQFIHINGMGTFWNGMKATYPLPVRIEHIEASFLCWLRHNIFQGNVNDLQSLYPAGTNASWINIASRQKQIRKYCEHTNECHPIVYKSHILSTVKNSFILSYHMVTDQQHCEIDAK
jgi:hypothetical protein